METADNFCGVTCNMLFAVTFRIESNFAEGIQTSGSRNPSELQGDC